MLQEVSVSCKYDLTHSTSTRTAYHDNNNNVLHFRKNLVIGHFLEEVSITGCRGHLTCGFRVVLDDLNLGMHACIGMLKTLLTRSGAKS